jgi:hypothetical protein
MPVLVAILNAVTPEEMADLVHLRRARDLMDREYARPLDRRAGGPALGRPGLRRPRSLRQPRPHRAGLIEASLSP